MRNKTWNRGLTLIELAVVLVFILIVGAVVVGFFSKWLFDRPGQTEARAAANMQAWSTKNKIGDIQRASCAHDSDGDGFGQCTIVTKEGEKIFLQCVAGFWQQLTGAEGCKENDTAIQMTGRMRSR